MDIIIIAAVVGLLLVAYAFGEIRLHAQGRDVHAWVVKLATVFKR